MSRSSKSSQDRWLGHSSDRDNGVTWKCTKCQNMNTAWRSICYFGCQASEMRNENRGTRRDESVQFQQHKKESHGLDISRSRVGARTGNNQIGRLKETNLEDARRSRERRSFEESRKERKQDWRRGERKEESSNKKVESSRSVLKRKAQAASEDSKIAKGMTLSERFGKSYEAEETKTGSNVTNPVNSEHSNLDSMAGFCHQNQNLEEEFEDVQNNEESVKLVRYHLSSLSPLSKSALVDSVDKPLACERVVSLVSSASSSKSKQVQLKLDRFEANAALEVKAESFVDVDVRKDASFVQGELFELVDQVPVQEDEKVLLGDADNASDCTEEVKYEEPSPEVFDHVDLRADTRFTPITQRMHSIICNAMLCHSEVVLSRHNMDISKHDIFTLTGTNWLNDQIIEIYLATVSQRSLSDLKMHPRVHSMSTFFFSNLSTRGYSSVKRWTKEVDIFAYDMVLVPIHMDSHWSLASIDFRVPGVFYYDSLGNTIGNNTILTTLLHYLREEHLNKKGKEIDLSNYAKHTMDTPLQQNGSDCGVFCCKVADYLSRDLPLDFCQDDMKYFRKRMIFEILKGVLLEP
eukprot:GFUD01025237.1.p1 GENE.GFUD01025237.1~~GFUD01025237.1.p1  ORF type:complete len:578 (-),score=147.22 GFUD01025237.1:98-1831(-)